MFASEFQVVLTELMKAPSAADEDQLDSAECTSKAYSVPTYPSPYIFFEDISILLRVKYKTVSYRNRMRSPQKPATVPSLLHKEVIGKKDFETIKLDLIEEIALPKSAVEMMNYSRKAE